MGKPLKWTPEQKLPLVLSVPHQFHAMHRDEIVQTLLRFGYLRKVAESEADAYLAHRDGPTSLRQEGARNDSVSEKKRLTDSPTRWRERSVEKERQEADEGDADAPIALMQTDKTVTDSATDKGILDRIGDRLERAFGRREGSDDEHR